ncbi:MAG: hypothetical protein WCR52_18415 [Bacteroidota bacterium]
MDQSSEEQRKTTLKELMGKSWNLELIISGASIVLTAYLPKIVEQQFYYFYYNLSTNWTGGNAELPVLAYSFFKTVSWLLIGMFVAHLVSRAFWVSLVGLQAAYPQGIQYDKIPNLPDSLKKYQEKTLGTLENYIVRLDRMCNQMLSFAFLIFLMGAMIGMLYYFIFYAVQIGRNYVPVKWHALIGKAVSYGVLILTLAFLILTRLARKPAGDERYGKYTIGYYRVVQQTFMPFLRRPIQFLTLTFTTNMPTRRYYITMFGLMVAVMGTVFMVFMRKMGELRSSHLIEFHSHYAAGDPQTELIAGHYDNLRSEDDNLPLVSLPADVVEEPFLKVYVVYPKMLDERLNKICPPFKLSHDIPRAMRNERYDSTNLACLTGFFHLYLNDSLYAHPDWVYHQKPGTLALGLMAYVPTAGLRAGKNLLTVRIPSAEKPDSLEVFGKMPFWFAGK